MGKSIEKNLRVSWRGRLQGETPTDVSKRLFKCIPHRCRSNTRVTYALASYGDENHVTFTFLDSETVQETRAYIIALQLPGLHVEDGFEGMTLLQSPEICDVDICAVHGLGGHAARSFVRGSHLWLRDLLPQEDLFGQARIMTFGYGIRLVASKTIAAMDDWAASLLRAVSGYRSDGGGDRPILFIGHSFGGLVVRRAMELLHQVEHSPDDQYNGLRLRNCGVVFLGTPHLGTALADYGAFASQIMSSLFGVRKEAILDQLKSLNNTIQSSARIWSIMDKKAKPPIVCLCESEKTRLRAGDYRVIVTPASAGFLGEEATMVMDTDHGTISKFDNPTSPAYKDVVRSLDKVLYKLRARKIPSMTGSIKLPGQPNPTAFRYPIPQDRRSYFGAALKRSTGQFLGQNDLLAKMRSATLMDPSNVGSILALSGTGGIGKTEVLLEYALQSGEEKHIFHCEAVAGRSFQDCIYRLATEVGSEVLEHEMPIADRQTLWNIYTVDQRVDAFIKWLASSTKGTCLVLLDDVDAFEADTDLERVATALRAWPHTVLLTTRNPSLGQALANRSYRQSTSLPVDGLAENMLEILMRRYMSGNIHISDSELKSICSITDGHVMAACRAVQFVDQELSLDADTNPVALFMSCFRDTSDNHSLRKRYLDFKPTLERSLSECFETSIQRLGSEQPIALRIVNFAAHTTAPDLDFRLFFQQERSWLSALPETYSRTKDLFGVERAQFRAALNKLLSTSAITRTKDNKFAIHPLMVEYLLQKQQHGGRTYILQQIMLLATISVQLNENRSLFARFIANSRRVAQRFAITIESISPPKDVLATICRNSTSDTSDVSDLTSQISTLRTNLQSQTSQRKHLATPFTTDIEHHTYLATALRLIFAFEQLLAQAPETSSPMFSHLCDDMLDFVDGINPIYYHKIHKLKRWQEKSRDSGSTFHSAGET